MNAARFHDTCLDTTVLARTSNSLHIAVVKDKDKKKRTFRLEFLLQSGERKQEWRTAARCEPCDQDRPIGIVQRARGQGVSYTYHTTRTDHKKCMDQLAAKCRHEQMTRLAILNEWTDIVCDDCKRIIDIRREV